MAYQNKNEYMRTYYQIGSTILEGYVKLVNGAPLIYDLDFILVPGAVQVQSPIEHVIVDNQTTVGDDNNHKEVLAGSSFTFSNIKCIGGLIKGDCTITINGVAIDYEDGDPFPPFNSELLLLNSITINQTTGKTIVFTLK